MKPYLYIMLAASIGLYSCSDKNKVNPNGFDYAVSVQNVTLEQSATTTISWPIKSLQGKPEPVSVTILDLPTNVYIATRSTDGTPPYTAFVNLSVNKSTFPGSYPVKLTSHSASTGEKTYKFNLINNFGGVGGDWNINATLNCGDNRVTIPYQERQTYQGFSSISGNGTFTSNMLNVDYILLLIQ